MGTDKKFLFAYAWGKGPNQHCALNDNNNNYNTNFFTGALQSPRFISLYNTEQKFIVDFNFRIQLLPVTSNPSAGYWEYVSNDGLTWGNVDVTLELVKADSTGETVIASNLLSFSTEGIQN